MARKRTILDQATETDLLARISRNEPAETIYTGIHGKLSLATIRRRKNELRGQAPKPIQALPQTTPEHDEVPENVPPQDVDYWLAKLNRIADVAETQGNLGALSSIAAKVATLMSLRHKTAPLPKPDPNDDPDHKARAKEGEDRFLQLIQGIFAT
jgi:hypothetical protein